MLKFIRQLMAWFRYDDQAQLLPLHTPSLTSARLIGIEFYNKQATALQLTIELCCIHVVIAPGMEYRIESHETEYRLECDADLIILYLQYEMAVKVFQRPYSTDFKNPGRWELINEF